MQTVKVLVYDVTRKLLDQREICPTKVSNLQVHANYPLGVYNVIVLQGENKEILLVIKK